MPLPIKDQAWPPPILEPVRAKQAEHAAWYSNEVAQLETLYTGTQRQRAGIVQRVARWFWSNRSTDLTQPERKLHVPVASDLCQASADLLFSEPPTFTVEDDDTQARLDLIMDETAHSVLASAAEVTAALGDVYLRATWDESVLPDRPFLQKIDADLAFPEFAFGRLQAVTFWTVLPSSSSLVYRHLERHDIREGVGVVEHGLYAGTLDALGKRVPLGDHPAVESLPVGEDSTISTLSPGLDVVHIPNMLPNRMFRRHPVGANLGRSDLDGIEPSLDALDEAYSSLMRDMRLGRSMLVVPETMLRSNGPGNGASFEHSEVFTGIQAPPSSGQDQRMSIEQVQFAIRIEEHERAIALLWNTIVRSAGYSAQTFGEDAGGGMTATEVQSKERRSYLTRDRKIRSFQPALTSITEKLLAIDAAVFRSGAKTDLPVDVAFADGVSEDPEAIARTAQLLAASVSASIETRVRLVHPTWDETAIFTEVARIRAEANLPPLADPDTLGEDGQGLSDEFGGA